MMKSGLLSIIAGFMLLGLVTGLSGCSNQPAGLSAELDQGIILEPGQTVVLPNESLSIRFVEVISDSRCPTGVQCIWAGEVTSLIEIDYQDQKKNMVLKQPGSSAGEDQFVNFQLSFTVEPYPEAGSEIKADDYRLHITISREP